MRYKDLQGLGATVTEANGGTNERMTRNSRRLLKKK